MLLIWCRTCGKYLDPIKGEPPFYCPNCQSDDIRSLGIYDPIQPEIKIDTQNIHLENNGTEEA